MVTKEDDWQPEDSLATDLGLSQSSPTEKQTFDEFNEDDTIAEERNEEVEVLIKKKPGKVTNSDGYPEQKLSPRENAFFFSKFISFL